LWFVLLFLHSGETRYTKVQKEIHFLHDWWLRGGRNFELSLVEVSATTYSHPGQLILAGGRC
jgi:hypothetical protein